MKNKTFQTGVRRLNIEWLWKRIENWTTENNANLNQLQAMTTRAGVVVHATTLHKVRDNGIRSINADALHALCTVLGVTWEEISEPLD